METPTLTHEHCTEVQELLKKGVYLSKQASHILDGSQHFEALGRLVFLDRYSIKSPRTEIQAGDLVVTFTLHDSKYPKKDLGIIKSIDDDDSVAFHMLTGRYATEEENFHFEGSLLRCDKPTESIEDTHHRVARAAACVEAPEVREHYEEQFYELLAKKYLQPAGRIMTGANSKDAEHYTKNLTLYNCYVLPSPKDTREGIVKTCLFDMVETMSRGGGVGINLSTLRPRFSYVRGVHGKSSGAVTWGGLYSFATAIIEQGGSRRGALMLMLEDWHPDMNEFIESKNTAGKIENANISVLISDKFMEAVKQDKAWTLEFPDYESMDKAQYNEEWDGDLQKWKQKGYPVKVYDTVSARELWEKIIKSAHRSAEPGIVFHERYNKLSNSWYFNRIISTNPCGEQGLPAWGVCNLSHLYLASFAKQIGQDETGPLYEMDWDELKRSARGLARFLDNMIDLNNYHHEENEKNQKNERRVGGGTLGLGELLIKLRIKYGSPESLPLIDQIYKTICIEMYKASSAIAKEKGSFPAFDTEKFLQSGFMLQMPEEVRQAIRENGIRNVTLTTQAPTGTVGSMLGTSTGIEPYYSFQFFQQSRLGFHEVMIPLAEQYKKADGSLPAFFTSAMTMGPKDHVKVQAAVQRWTDSSISKTANAPPSFTVEDTKELYEYAYDLGCKGVTIYRDGSRNEQVLSLDKKTEEKNLASSLGKLDEFNKASHAEPEQEALDLTKYGSDQGLFCPQCKEGTMIKIGGCTECSKQCGFKGACDMK